MWSHGEGMSYKSGSHLTDWLTVLHWVPVGRMQTLMRPSLYERLFCPPDHYVNTGRSGSSSFSTQKGIQILPRRYLTQTNISKKVTLVAKIHRRLFDGEVPTRSSEILLSGICRGFCSARLDFCQVCKSRFPCACASRLVTDEDSF